MFLFLDMFRQAKSPKELLMCDYVSVRCELTEHGMEEFERVFPITVVYLTFFPPFFSIRHRGGTPMFQYCSPRFVGYSWPYPTT